MELLKILRRSSIFFSFTFIYLSLNAIKGANKEKYEIKPSWKVGELFDIWIYAMEESIQVNFNEKDLIFYQNSSSFPNGIIGPIERTLEINLKKSIFSKSKPSDLFAHIYITKVGTHPDPLKCNDHFDPRASAYRRLPLISRVDDKLSWYPEIKIAFIKTDKIFGEGGIPLNPSIIRHMSIVPDNPVSLPNNVIGREYLPFIMTSEFWRLREKIVYDVKKKNPLSIHIKTISLTRFRILCEIEETMRLGEEILLSYSKNSSVNDFFLKEWDKIKDIFFDCNPLLLGMTIVISILHFIFSFLSFKTDFSFWKKNGRKESNNLSKRSLIIAIIMHFIILLYLFDQDKRSYMVLIPSIISFLIECWKLSMLSPIRTPPTKLDKYDSDAMKGVLLLIIPIIIARFVYSIKNNHYTSIYSETLRILTGATYSFGFISMFPQLYLNYKTKSVASLPWNVLIYKALNTFIDDLFSFVVKMPRMHRIACLRDDVVFVIYLYQCWIYPSKDIIKENSYKENKMDLKVEGGWDDNKEEKFDVSMDDNGLKKKRKSTRIKIKSISVNS